MVQNSFALMTNVGRAKEAAALANATVIEITHIAIGDGMTVPSGGETALYSEIARKPISGHGTVVGASNVAYFDIFLAADEGPYTIREAGLYDVDGDLIAIARYDPPINKPIPSSGQTVEGTVRLEVAFSNVANIVIVVDPSFQIPLQRLSRLPWLPVISMSTIAPPASPAVGDVYLIPTGATGPWAGHTAKIAEYKPAGWGLITAPEGHGISLPDGRIFERIGGTYVEKIAMDVQSGKWNYAVAGGTANALTAALNPVVLGLVEGLTIRLKITVRNTGAVTLAVNGLGAKGIVRPSGSALLADDLVGGSVIEVIYDGARFVLVGMPKATTTFGFFTAAGSGKVTVPAGCTGAEVELWGGGGGGGWGSAGRSGDGGGGGAYAYKRLFGLIAGQELNYVIGAAGDRGFSSVQDGTAGGTTTFNGAFSAGGGSGGKGGLNSSYATEGGTPTGADVGLLGGAGGPGINLGASYGAGPGGAAPKGGLGGPGNSGGGPVNGTGPGGGGSGGSNSNAGGFGAPGSIFIRWF